MTGLFEASVKDYLKQARSSLKNATSSLQILKNQDSDYALEHRMLIAPLEQVVAIWEAAQSGVEMLIAAIRSINIDDVIEQARK